MKKIIFSLITLALIIPSVSFAHPGGTDSSGCHTCRTNCSSWGLSYGEYHCHNNRGSSQPLDPIHSTYGAGGTGYTTPAPDYAYPSYPTTPSCPLKSSYDSLSGECKCKNGFEWNIGKTLCVVTETPISASPSIKSLIKTKEIKKVIPIGNTVKNTSSQKIEKK